MSNKKRVMLVLKYLQENTNEFHKVNSENIISELANYDINVDRKTIYNDIKELNEMDFNIEKDTDGYYYNNELFELPELRILMDEIKSNGFLAKKRTDVIAKKLLSLTNKYDRKLLESRQRINVEGGNETNLYNIDKLMHAIADKTAVSFYYYDLDLSKKKVYRKNKKLYRVYPYELVATNNRYYLICNTIGHDGLSNYRLDKMDDVMTIKDQFYDKAPDLSDYMKKTFNMFSGESAPITLKCHRSLYDEVEKKFGDLKIIRSNEQDDYFMCYVKVNVSPTFFSWVFTFGGKIQIETEEVKKQFAQMCKQMANIHK